MINDKNEDFHSFNGTKDLNQNNIINPNEEAIKKVL